MRYNLCMNQNRQQIFYGLFAFFIAQTINVYGSGSSTNDTLVLENDYVSVHNEVAAYPNEINQEVGSRVIVALEPLTVKSGTKIVKLSRGGVLVFKEGASYQSPKGLFFEVAIKKSHPPFKKPQQWIEPLKNTTVYEDQELRVFEERLPAKQDRELHSHSQRVVVRLNEVQLTDPRFHPTGQPGEGIQVPNTVKFAEPVVHVVRNLSDIPLFNIVIEFNANQNNLK